MNLTKENVKKICGIILFTVVVLVIVQNYEKVGNAIGLLWGIIFPFVLGGIIAFILNIPMRAIEKLLFNIHMAELTDSMQSLIKMSSHRIHVLCRKLTILPI